MKAVADVVILSINERSGKEGKIFRSVEVTQADERTVRLNVPVAFNGLADQVKAAYLKRCRITFVVAPGMEWRQFNLDLYKVEPLEK